MKGETVEVLRPTITFDSQKREQKTWDSETVENVLVSPATSQDLATQIRLNETKSVYTLAFPKTYDKPLRGCRCIVRGETFDVIGDPQYSTLENTPTKWWYSVEVKNVDG